MKDLEKECAKKEKADPYIKKIYAKQVATCDKNREKILIQKGNVQSLGYTLDTFFCRVAKFEKAR